MPNSVSSQSSVYLWGRKMIVTPREGYETSLCHLLLLEALRARLDCAWKAGLGVRKTWVPVSPLTHTYWAFRSWASDFAVQCLFSQKL